MEGKKGESEGGTEGGKERGGGGRRQRMVRGGGGEFFCRPNNGVLFWGLYFSACSVVEEKVDCLAKAE